MIAVVNNGEIVWQTAIRIEANNPVTTDINVGVTFKTCGGHSCSFSLREWMEMQSISAKQPLDVARLGRCLGEMIWFAGRCVVLEALAHNGRLVCALI